MPLRSAADGHALLHIHEKCRADDAFPFAVSRPIATRVFPFAPENFESVRAFLSPATTQHQIVSRLQWQPAAIAHVCARRFLRPAESPPVPSTAARFFARQARPIFE